MTATGRPAPPSPERLSPPEYRPSPHSAPPLAPPSTFAVAARALWRRRKLVVALPIIFGALAVGLAIPRPRFYLARAAFIASEPQPLSGSLGALSSVASQLGVPALGALASSSASSSAQFYGDLILSNAILHEVVTTTYDASAPGDYGGRPFKGTLVDYLDVKAKTRTDAEIAAMNQFGKGILKVVVDRPTGIVRLQVSTKNRLLSALVMRRVLDMVNDFNLRRRQTQAGAEREFDARRTRAALDTLHAAETALADFRATNIDFSRSPRLAAREAELQRRVSLAQQTYTTVAQRYEIANIEAVRNTPVVTVLDAPEGLVEARPRHTVGFVVGAFAAGLLIACVIALGAERFAGTR